MTLIHPEYSGKHGKNRVVDDKTESYLKVPLSAIIFMTRECDDSRHFADQQQSSLTWDRVYPEDTYVRTSHHFGHQNNISAGVSFDVGGAQISIGTGTGFHGRQHWHQRNGYGNDAYGSGYDSDFYGRQPFRNGYHYRNNGYDSRNSGYDYGDQGYTDYRNSRNYDNAYRNIYGQIVSPRVEYAETQTSLEAQRYYYQQLANEQRLQDSSYGRYQAYDNYNRDYARYRDPNAYDQYYANNFQSYRRPDYAYQYDSNNDYYGPYTPTRNRFDLRFQGDGFSVYGSYDLNNGYADQRNWNNRYSFDAPYLDDYSRSYNRYDRGNYNRYDNRYSDYDYNNDRYYGVNGYDYYGGGQSNSDWIRMRATLQSMLGHSPREFNRNVPDDLGCATIVSAALRRAHGVNICDTNVDGLESSLRRNGYTAVPVRFAQPGDCIIAHRYGNRHGHAAIYVGDGKVVNNSSAQGRVIVAPLSNFASRDYESVVAYRRV